MTRRAWLSCALLIGILSAVPDSPSLTGRWRAWFRLDSAAGLPSVTRAREVTGRLEFRPAPPASLPHDVRTWRRVHTGTLAIDFTPLGFAVAGSETLGWYGDGDTVRIILDPSVDHGHVELVGSGSADQIDGRWRLIGDPAQAEGVFQLRRPE
jgi:hypothetical protein